MWESLEKLYILEKIKYSSVRLKRHSTNNVTLKEKEKVSPNRRSLNDAADFPLIPQFDMCAVQTKNVWSAFDTIFVTVAKGTITDKEFITSQKPITEFEGSYKILGPRPTKVFRINEYLSGGAFGRVYKGSFGEIGNEKASAIKICKTTNGPPEMPPPSPDKKPNLYKGTMVVANDVDLTIPQFLKSKTGGEETQQLEKYETKEIALHAYIFCKMRDNLHELLKKYELDEPIAKVPEPFFAAYIHFGDGQHHQCIGMKSLDISLQDYILSCSYDDFVEIMSSVAKLLQILQINEFIHGDLHSENIMLKYDKTSSKMKAFLIDFGFSSIKKENGEKVVASNMYEEYEFNKCLDLLMLFTEMRESIESLTSAKRNKIDGKIFTLCAEIIKDFWDDVMKQFEILQQVSPPEFFKNGYNKTESLYPGLSESSYKVASIATKMYEVSLSTVLKTQYTHAHHFLYATPIDYPRCYPENLLTILQK